MVNGRYGISRATFDKVAAAVDELGYEASLGARSLRSSKTGVLGVLVAEFEPFSVELLKGVSEGIGGTGYELLAWSGGHRGAAVGWERRSLARLGGTLIDGAILVTPTVVDAGAGIPVVAVDPHTGPADVPSVASDNLAGAVLATEHLLGLGHRRIALLSGRRRPGVGAAARGGVPDGHGGGRGRRSTSHWSAPATTARTPRSHRPASCSATRTGRRRSSPPTT